MYCVLCVLRTAVPSTVSLNNKSNKLLNRQPFYFKMSLTLAFGNGRSCCVKEITPFAKCTDFIESGCYASQNTDLVCRSKAYHEQQRDNVKRP